MKIKEFWTKNNIIILAAILIAVFVMARGIGKVKTAVEKYKAKKAPVGEELQEIVPVKVFKVKRVPVFKDVLPILGNVEGYKEIDLKFESAGVIQAINFREGERVAEGETIASIDSRDALLKMKYNEIEMDKVAKLYDLGAVQPYPSLRSQSSMILVLCLRQSMSRRALNTNRQNRLLTRLA